MKKLAAFFLRAFIWGMGTFGTSKYKGQQSREKWSVFTPSEAILSEQR